jgi:hypothetical protein
LVENDHLVLTLKQQYNISPLLLFETSKLKEAETQLKRESIGEDNITAAKEKIAEGIHLVCHREKLVKLADSSQLGWKVVQ